MNAHFAKPATTRSTAADRRLLRELAYVDGRWTASEANRKFRGHDPATGTLAFVSALDAGDDKGHRCRRTRLSGLAGALAAGALENPSRLVRADLAAKDDLALLMTLEQGKPLAGIAGEIDYAASFIEWYAEEASA
jgi:aspartate-semialdehyde dehydrogenase